MIDYDAKTTAVLMRRTWILATPDGDKDIWRRLVDDVRGALIESRPSRVAAENAMDRAVTYAYCPILLAACRDNGSDRQERAFTELHQWIFPRVYARVDNAQDAEDVAQKVLMRVYQNLHRIEKPHGFLGYVSVIIRREVIDCYRRMGRMDQFEEEPPDGLDSGEGDGLDDLVGPDSFLAVEIDAAEEEIIRMIYDCLPKKKWRRAYALVALTLFGQTAAEVAESLQVTANAVYLLHFNAKRDLLQHCPQLIELMLQKLAPSQRLSLKEGKS